MSEESAQKEKKQSEPSVAVKRINEVRESAAKQKNRAKVLVYASSIENDLSELFAKIFTGSSGIKKDKLLDPQKASSLDLASKIELAYRLGLFSHRFRAHLDMIRDFRNDCAHLEADFDFSSSDYKSRIKGAYLELGKEARAAFSAKDDDYEEMFHAVSTLCILQLQFLIDGTEKNKEKELENFYIDGAVNPSKNS